MRIHHLNCGTFCPLGGKHMDGVSHGLLGHLVCHCLLIETSDGLVLVDTGLGMGDVDHPVPRLSAFYLGLLNVKLRREDTAVFQIEKLGFKARDVRHIVMTHLDFDHAGGLEDFPAATVHVLQAEADAATNHRDGFVSSRRYRPGQWDEVKSWRKYEPAGEPWFGFDAVRQLAGLPPEILLIPLHGHTLGHAGVAVDTGKGWLLHCGDAYFHHTEVGRRYPTCPPGKAAYQMLMEADRRMRLKNQARLRQLSVERAGEVTLFCAHDVIELERMRGGPLDGERVHGASTVSRVAA